MKKYGMLLIMVLVVCFTGCSENGKKENPIETQTPIAEMQTPALETQSPDGKTAEAVLEAKVMEKQGNSYLVINRGEDAKNAQLYTLGSEKELKVGELVDIYYNGMVLESYPAQLGEVYGIKKVGEEECLADLYLNVFKDLYEMDEGLNSDIEEIALNLEEVSNLSSLEKEYLFYRIWCDYQKETFFSTYEKLKEEGRIIDNGMNYPDGILVTIKVEEKEEDSFSFSLEKWRSGLGAIGYNNGKAKKEAGKWSYQPGDFWIS